MADEDICAQHQITLDVLDEIRQTFAEFDLDGNGHITTKELGSAFGAVGMNLPGYKLRDIVAEIDRDKNGTIELEEFIAMYSDMKSKEVAQTFRQAITKKEGIEAKGGTSEASSEGTTHSVSEEEKVAFVEYINSNLGDDPDLKNKLPLDPKSDALFKSGNDGILLCKLINLSVPDTIDERAINKGSKLNVYLKHENHTLALNSASSIGCNIVNIGPDDLMRGTEHLMLGLLWQIIRVGLFAKIDLQHNPGLFRLLQEGEDPEQLLKVSPEDLLIRWVNYQMEQAGHPRRIHNFSSDIKDSEVYTYLLNQIAPAGSGVDISPMQESDHHRRAERVLDNADKIGCRQFVQASDIVSGNPKLNMAFVANLFNMYPNLKAPEEGEGEDFERFEETREEKSMYKDPYSLDIDSSTKQGAKVNELLTSPEGKHDIFADDGMLSLHSPESNKALVDTQTTTLGLGVNDRGDAPSGREDNLPSIRDSLSPVDGEPLGGLTSQHIEVPSFVGGVGSGGGSHTGDQGVSGESANDSDVTVEHETKSGVSEVVPGVSDLNGHVVNSVGGPKSCETSVTNADRRQKPDVLSEVSTERPDSERVSSSNLASTVESGADAVVTQSSKDSESIETWEGGTSEKSLPVLTDLDSKLSSTSDFNSQEMGGVPSKQREFTEIDKPVNGNTADAAKQSSAVAGVDNVYCSESIDVAVTGGGQKEVSEQQEVSPLGVGSTEARVSYSTNGSKTESTVSQSEDGLQTSQVSESSSEKTAGKGEDPSAAVRETMGSAQKNIEKDDTAEGKLDNAASPASENIESGGKTSGGLVTYREKLKDPDAEKSAGAKSASEKKGDGKGNIRAKRRKKRLPTQFSFEDFAAVTFSQTGPITPYHPKEEIDFPQDSPSGEEEDSTSRLETEKKDTPQTERATPPAQTQDSTRLRAKQTPPVETSTFPKIKKVKVKQPAKAAAKYRDMKEKDAAATQCLVCILISLCMTVCYVIYQWQ